MEQPQTISDRVALAKRFLDEHEPSSDAFDTTVVDDVERGDAFE